MTKRCIGSVELTGTTLSDGREAGLVGLGDLISGEDQTNDLIKVENRNDYYICPANTSTTLGGTGAAGDFLHTVTFRTNGTAVFSLLDGTDTLVSFVGISGVNYIETITIDAVAKTGWIVTLGSGAVATASGRFTA